jgi:hypothetical protein
LYAFCSFHARRSSLGERAVFEFSEAFANYLQTSGIIQWFLALIPSYPHVAEKAYEELDRVVGRERWPNTEDEPNLPYIRAIIKEVWNTSNRGNRILTTLCIGRFSVFMPHFGWLHRIAHLKTSLTRELTYRRTPPWYLTVIPCIITRNAILIREQIPFFPAH